LRLRGRAQKERSRALGAVASCLRFADRYHQDGGAAPPSLRDLELIAGDGLPNRRA